MDGCESAFRADWGMEEWKDGRVGRGYFPLVIGHRSCGRTRSSARAPACTSVAGAGAPPATLNIEHRTFNIEYRTLLPSPNFQGSTPVPAIAIRYSPFANRYSLLTSGFWFLHSDFPPPAVRRTSNVECPTSHTPPVSRIKFQVSNSPSSLGVLVVHSALIRHSLFSATSDFCPLVSAL